MVADLNDKVDGLTQLLVFVDQKFKQVEKGLLSEKEKIETDRKTDTRTKIHDAYQSVLSSIDDLTQAKESIRSKMETVFATKPTMAAIIKAEAQVARLKTGTPSKSVVRRKKQKVKTERDRQFVREVLSKVDEQELNPEELLSPEEAELAAEYEKTLGQLKKPGDEDEEKEVEEEIKDKKDSGADAVASNLAEAQRIINSQIAPNTSLEKLLAQYPNIQNWKEIADEEGRKYYWNEKSGNKQWTKPTDYPIILWETVDDHEGNPLPNWKKANLTDGTIAYLNDAGEYWEHSTDKGWYWNGKDYMIDTSFLKGGKPPQKILASTKWIPSSRTRIRCRERSTFTKRRLSPLPTSRPQSSTTTNRSSRKATKSRKQTQKARRIEKRRGLSTVNGRPTSSSTRF